MLEAFPGNMVDRLTNKQILLARFPRAGLTKRVTGGKLQARHQRVDPPNDVIRSSHSTSGRSTRVNPAFFPWNHKTHPR